MPSQAYRATAILLLALVLSWLGGLSAHDALEHVGEWEHGDECGLFHHADSEGMLHVEPPTPATLESESLAALMPRRTQGRLPIRGCDRGPPPSV